MNEAGYAPMPDGGRLAYTVRGDAGTSAPVLLLRPLGGSARLWGAFGTRLAERHRVLSYDYRGSGRSSGAELRGTRALAADAVALLDHLGIAAVRIFGLSFGGMVATWAAAELGERARALCIASAPIRGLDLGTGGLRRALSLAACLGEAERDVEVCMVLRVMSARFRLERPDEVSRITHVVRAEAQARGVLLMRAVAGLFHDGRSAAPAIRCPTLVLRGALDTLFSPVAAREAALAIAGAGLETLEGAGHDVTLEAPDLTAARVVALFRAAAC